MIFPRNKAIFGLFLTLLVANLPISNGNIIENELSQVENELMTMNISGVKPLFKLFPMPLAGIFGGNVLSIKAVDSFFKDPKDFRNSVSKLVKVNVEFAKLQNRLTEESRDVAEKLIPYDEESRNFFSPMAKTLKYVSKLYSNIICILMNYCYQKSKQRIIDGMINETSMERANLKDISFWSNKYESIGEQFVFSDPERYFFDHVFGNYENSKVNDDDCNTESLHTRIFKAWVHITNVLTEGYSVVAAAHAVEMSRIISESSESQVVNIILEKWKVVLGEFRMQMKAIMLDANSVLADSSREIRNCGSFKLVKGKTFERLNFIQNRLIFHKPVHKGPCIEDDVDEPLLNNMKFSMFNCTDFDRGTFHLYMDRNDKERTLHKLDRINNGSVEETMGRVGNESLHPKIIDGDHTVCKFTVCQAYQRRELKYSTQFVQAQQDYVVTGIRWKIRKGVIYIDIQEGKFIDGTQVDESTVHWKETPENDKEVQSLNKNLRSIALTDIILPEKIYVKGVSLKDVNGIITMAITGQGTDDTGTKLLDETSKIYENTQLQKMTELKLDQPDDPELAPVRAKKLVMRKQNEYFINFQPTDLKKDLGRTTIPYFDIREVVTTPSAPISGLGIYHEAVPGYGGFVGLKMFSPDFSYMINEDKFDSFWNFHKKKVVPA